MQPTRVLPAVSVLSLISVEYGGWALLGSGNPTEAL
jgi:hypothetical protein